MMYEHTFGHEGYSFSSTTYLMTTLRTPVDVFRTAWTPREKRYVKRVANNHCTVVLLANHDDDWNIDHEHNHIRELADNLTSIYFSNQDFP